MGFQLVAAVVALFWSFCKHANLYYSLFSVFMTQDEWVVTIVQLIALFYKDQHVENMQKLLGTWLNSVASESSDDGDESNTSPPVMTRSAFHLVLIN